MKILIYDSTLWLLSL